MEATCALVTLPPVYFVGHFDSTFSKTVDPEESLKIDEHRPIAAWSSRPTFTGRNSIELVTV